MIFLLILCVKLSILHLCVSEYRCGEKDITREDPKEIILTEFNSEFNQQLNNKFIEKCSPFYVIRVNRNQSFINNVKNYIVRRNETPEFSRVISLYVPHFYDQNRTSPRYAGDINNDTLCNITNRSNDCRGFKIISKTLSETNEDLYDFVEQMDYINGTIQTREKCLTFVKYIKNEMKLKNLDTVLLCLDYKEAHYHYLSTFFSEDLKLHITTTDKCSHVIELYNNNFLVVLAPKPFEMNYEYSVPVIFYETAYMSPEIKSNFPNSMNLTPWRLLKYGFLKFIKNVGWSRLVIVTDDSPYSIAFEDQLTTLFNKERITYKVVRCEDAICDVRKITKSLNSIRAKIVIANVEEKNAEFLIQSNRASRIWLVRDMDRNKILNQHVFSFTLINNIVNCDLNKNILNGFRSMAQAYRELTAEDFELSKKQFYRNFIKLMESTKESKAIAYIYWNSQEIASMHVDISGAEEISFKNPFKVTVLDGPPCLARSFNYSRPCEDELILILMFVAIIFFTTLLVITCYFHKNSPFHNIRYHHLY